MRSVVVVGGILANETNRLYSRSMDALGDGQRFPPMELHSHEVHAHDYHVVDELSDRLSQVVESLYVQDRVGS